VVNETKNPWVKRTFNVRKTYFSQPSIIANHYFFTLSF